MKIMIDTNVIMDVLFSRLPHVDASEQVISLIAKGEITGLICATSLTTIHYLLSKKEGKEEAILDLKKLLEMLDVAPVNRMTFNLALELNFNDFEDSVICAAAKMSGAQIIVTRNIKDFKNSVIPVYSPLEFLRMYESFLADYLER